ncbi:MAG: lipopolysaccharide biosynthesis [Okeania sp. SIO3I5]|uniref:GumC family protein n=1 Tax=Okeania sp. SIO3I5 TaxID=2607805 RepID=UPI0013B5EDE3|nr:tyrosine-protein kinase domain-containing protein [Okeania sp. SIO3I5]NEQ34943.1 lipopolysaccharide biosynthesis [Okeania sp. SIO3I5]
MAIPIVKRYLIALGLYKWVGVATFTLGLGVSGIVALQPTPEAKHTILGALRSIRPAILFSNTGNTIQERAAAVTPDMLLNNNDAVKQAAAEKVLVTPRKLKGAKLRLKEGVYLLSYEDTDSEKAVEVVDALMAEIIKESRKINATYQTSIINEVKKRLPPAIEELRDAQQKLQKFERDEEALLITSRAAGLPGQIAASRQQQTQINLELEGVEAQINSLEEQLGLSADQAYVARALAADPIIANLRVQLYQVENELNKLLLDFTEEYPPVVELRRQKQVAEQQLQQRAAEVLGGNGIAAPLRQVDQIRVDASLDPTRQQLAETLIALKTQKEQLERQLQTTIEIEQKLEVEYRNIPDKQLELTQLQEEVAVKKSRVDQMRATLEDAEAAEAEITSSLAVAQKAFVHKKGEAGEKSLPLMMAIGGLAGIVVGGGLIFVLGMLSGKFYSWEEIKTTLKEKDVPLLGLLPDVMLFDPDIDIDIKAFPLLLERNSPYLEFYEKLRTNLQRQGSHAPKVLVLSSGAKKEGKTFCAYNLAIAAARAGKRTLVIEADLRSPSKAKSLKIVPHPYSCAEPLRYYGDINDCIQQVPEIENLYMIPSPGVFKQPGGIIESSEMQRLLSDSRHRFDFVILDAPCMTQNNDAFILEPYTDGMIIVTRPHITVSGMLAEVIEQLTNDEEDESSKSGPKFLGVVINGADIPVEFPLEPLDDLDFSEPQIADSPRPSIGASTAGVLKSEVRS